MATLTRLATRLAADDRGSEVMEYAMIAGLISVVAVAIVAAFGTKLLARWTNVNSSV